ncbi:hypothetical protein ABT009_20100 [Streptomyces sp. NPDC002896]|uniref:hypothetical protein n=1 Tax=Streptomyces sp. NPDC002896 TaxID=3154438 RepID=UPI003325F287
MDHRSRRLLRGVLNCAGVLWFGYQAVAGDGPMQVFSVLVMIFLGVLAVLTVLDRILPPRKRRRARERDGTAERPPGPSQGLGRALGDKSDG